MATYTQVATILQKALGQEEGLLVLEYFEKRIPPDVARRQDVSEAEAALRLEIEKLRAEVTKEIEQLRADVTKEIEQLRADVAKEIEQLRAEVTKEIERLRLEIEQVRLEIEKVRAEMKVQIERSQATQTRWAFLFWVTQMAILVGILLRLLS